MTVSGTVSATHKDTLSIILANKQYVVGSTGTDTLYVRGHIEQGPRWKEPEKMLPPIDSIIHFEGTLDEIENDDEHIYAVISIEFIVYQHKPKSDNEKKTVKEDDKNIWQ